MDLGALTVKIGADLKGLSVGLSRAVSQVKGFSLKTQAYMKANAASFKSLGRNLAIMGAVITAFSYGSVKAFAGFEQEMANVSTMLDDVGMKQMPAFTDAIQNMSVEFGEATNSLSKGLYDILSASVAPEKALGVLDASAKAAKAGLTDTGVAADAVTTILNAYSMEADKAGVVTDKLFAIVKRGKTTFGELAPNIGMVATTASVAGFSLDELGATIATLTRAGLSTSEAITSVNGVLRAFLKPTDEAKELARGLGFELNTATLQSEGLYGVLQKLKGVSPEELSILAPRIQGLRGFASALKQLEGYATDLDTMLNSLGMTQAAYDKNTATLTHSMAKAKQSVVFLGREIGLILAPAVEKISKFIVETTKNLRVWVKEHETLTTGIITCTAAVGALMLALGPLIFALPGLSIAVGVLGKAFVGMGNVAILAWTKVLLPIAPLIAALAGIGLAVYVIRAEIKQNVEGMGDSWVWLKDTVKAVIESISNIFKQFLDWLSPAWRNTLKSLGTHVKEFGNIAISGLAGTKAWLKSWWESDGDFDKAAKAYNFAFDYMLEQKPWQEMSDAVTTAGLEVKDSFVAVVKAAKDNLLVPMSEETVRLLNKILTAVKTQAAEDVEYLKGLFKSLGDEVNSISLLPQTGGGVPVIPDKKTLETSQKGLDTIGKLTAGIKKEFKEIGTSVKDNIGYAFEGLIEKTMTFKEAISSIIKDIASQFARMALNLGIQSFGMPAFAGFGSFMGFAGGGLVPRPSYASTGLLARGIDTMPAMLTPGEAVLSKPVTDALRKTLGVGGGSEGGGQQPININIINPWDGRSVLKAMESKAVSAVLRNQGHNGPIRTMIRDNV